MESRYFTLFYYLFSKAVYEKNKNSERPGENLVESEKQFFENLKLLHFINEN